jgi:hypothetical protein
MGENKPMNVASVAISDQQRLSTANASAHCRLLFDVVNCGVK